MKLILVVLIYFIKISLSLKCKVSKLGVYEEEINKKLYTFNFDKAEIMGLELVRLDDKKLYSSQKVMFDKSNDKILAIVNYNDTLKYFLDEKQRNIKKDLIRKFKIGDEDLESKITNVRFQMFCNDVLTLRGVLEGKSKKDITLKIYYSLAIKIIDKKEPSGDYDLIFLDYKQRVIDSIGLKIFKLYNRICIPFGELDRKKVVHIKIVSKKDPKRHCFVSSE